MHNHKIQRTMRCMDCPPLKAYIPAFWGTSQEALDLQARIISGMYLPKCWRWPLFARVEKKKEGEISSRFIVAITKS